LAAERTGRKTQSRGRTRAVPVAVASNDPLPSVSLPSAKLTVRPRRTTLPSPVIVPSGAGARSLSE